MALSKKAYNERLSILVKAYVTMQKKATSRQIAEWINFNNFGITITAQEVSSFMKENIHKEYKSSRGCLRNCYGYIDSGKNPRMYYILE